MNIFSKDGFDGTVERRDADLAALCEQLEALKWYQRQLEESHDTVVTALVKYNRDLQLDHAAATLEALRRQYPELDQRLRKHLFTDDLAIGAERSRLPQTTTPWLGIELSRSLETT